MVLLQDLQKIQPAPQSVGIIYGYTNSCVAAYCPEGAESDIEDDEPVDSEAPVDRSSYSYSIC